MKILALDLGKTKTVACEYEAVAGEARYATIKTRRDALHDLIVKYGPDRVVFEIGPAGGWLSDMVQTLGIALEVANISHPAWRWSNTKKKTDRSDALRLAQLSALRQLLQVRVPDRETRQWRSFIRYRHHLVRRRTGIKNRIRAILEREGDSLLYAFYFKVALLMYWAAQTVFIRSGFKTARCQASMAAASNSS
jgi:transposase